jgi:hypothetical protein
MLLVEVQKVFGKLSGTISEQAEARDVTHRLSSLLEQLRQCLAHEGARGEVAIALACDRRLDAEVSGLTVRQRWLEQTLSDLLEALRTVKCPPAQFEQLETTLAEFSVEMVNYLSDKRDALRRSLATIGESVDAEPVADCLDSRRTCLGDIAESD